MPKVQSFDHEKGGHSRRGRRTSSSLAEINVVPLVDVMLVLLIIFMVTAPMMQRGLEIQLPVARRGQPISAEPVYVTLPLSYRKDKRVSIGPLGQGRTGVDRRARRARAPGARVAADQAGLSPHGRRRDRAGISQRDRQAEGRRRRSHRPRRVGCTREWAISAEASGAMGPASEAHAGGRGPRIKHGSGRQRHSQSRKREPGGLKKTAAISLAAHAAAIAVILMIPSVMPRAAQQPRVIMNISLGGIARAEDRRHADDWRAGRFRPRCRRPIRRSRKASLPSRDGDAAEDDAARSEAEAAHATEADCVV